MPIRLETIVRYCLSRGKNGIGAALVGVAALLLSGCWATLFDSPPGNVSEKEEAALKRIEELSSKTQQDVTDKATEFGKSKVKDATEVGKSKAKDATNSARQGMADTMKGKRSDGSKPGEASEEDELIEWGKPRLTFEKVKSDMPQLSVWGLGEAIFTLNDNQIELGKMTQEGRLVLVGPGHYRLQVKCPFDPPFSADFSIVKDDRVVLRGRCSPGWRVITDEKKRN